MKAHDISRVLENQIRISRDIAGKISSMLKPVLQAIANNSKVQSLVNRK